MIQILDGATASVDGRVVVFAKFRVGQRVRLQANKSEGWDEEVGTVDAIEGRGMYIVRVKPQERGDDGMREVNESNMRPA